MRHRNYINDNLEFILRKFGFRNENFIFEESNSLAMKKIFTLFFLITLSFSFSQTAQQKIIDRTFVDFQLNQSVELNGKIYSIGVNKSSAEWYPALMKQDENLNVEWLKVFYRGSFFIDKFQDFSHMVVTQDNHLIVGGSNGDFWEAKTWVLKIDTTGNVVWHKDIGTPFFNEGNFTVNNASDGVMIGSRVPTGGGPEQLRLFNFDSNGDTLWTRWLISPFGSSLTTREGYLKPNGDMIFFINDGGKSFYLELNASGDLLAYKKIDESGGDYFRCNAVEFANNQAFWVGSWSGGGAAIIKVDDSENIIWAKRYPELSAFTGVHVTSNGDVVVNGINNNGVYQNLATTLRTDADGNPINEAKAYGQLPGYHVIPFKLTEINDHYLFTGFRTSQGWRTGYQILTDTTLSAGTCYERTFPVTQFSMNVVKTDSVIDFLYDSGLSDFLTSPDPLSIGNSTFVDYAFDNTITADITISGDDCGGQCTGTASASALGGNAPYTYEWSNGQTGEMATDLCSDDEIVLLTGDQSGCFAYDTVQITLETPVTDICLVTVDPTSTQNLIVWEKPVTDVIDGFKVYRDVVGNYNTVGYVPYDSLSQFLDNTNGVNPNITSYRYKIATVDTCGSESALSDFHETIHLTVNPGSGNTVNCIWDNYEGSTFAYNRILRDTVGNGNWEVMDSVAGNVFTWTDTDPAVTVAGNYLIEIIFSSVCTATGKAQDYNSSRSNTTASVEGGPVAALNAADMNFSIYPNPANDQLFIESVESGDYMITVSDLSGRIVLQDWSVGTSQLDVSELKQGTYFITLSIEGRSSTQRFMKL
jgi:hypothetical protein